MLCRVVGAGESRIACITISSSSWGSFVEPKAPLRFAFSIAMGVRKGDTDLRDRIDAVLKRRKKEIDEILDSYGVPRAAPAAGRGAP